MSLGKKIKSAYRKAADYIGRLLTTNKPELSVDLVPEITRYFLSDAIDARVEVLTAELKKPKEEVHPSVLKEYAARVEEAIRQELKNPALGSRTRALLDKDLGSIKLSSQFSDEICTSRELLLQIMLTPGTFKRRRISQFEALILLSLLLRALQEVALNIVRFDYPLRIPASDVPPDTQTAIRKVLRRLDDLWRRFPSPLEIKSAKSAETELRVLVARNSGSACLPLRPIPTSPLASDDFAKPYVGIPDEEVLRLSRQIRHADGTILVTGYRGVGKSSFVNRVVYEALGAQETFPEDGCLLVPITVNLAKVSGVQNILRITLRAVRDALLEPNSFKARPIPLRSTRPSKPIALPLNTEDEIEPLQEAYIRATYKVTMGNSIVSQNSREFGSAFSFDPGKLFAPLTGLELGKFISGGIKKSRVERINRELNLLDYDENAAEDDLGRLISRLARPRPLLGTAGPQVRIKLLFIFDELDKMDVETGLRPMIEGLKNLFLQQYAVFILVTSKKFYYDLLKDRAIEDAMLNSYFSAIVNVPLLQFAQAREMVKNWVYWEASDQLKTASPNELKLIEQLTRVLVYRSFGNPRDMIRELRLMQQWADTEQPYLTDQGSNAPAWRIFAAIQDCVEKTAGQSSGASNEGGGAVPLISNRLVGDESRLEQIRRGLYILTEELIKSQKLAITLKQPSKNGGTPSPPPPPADGAEIAPTPQATPPPTIADLMEHFIKLTKPESTQAGLSALEKIQKDNFSLVSLEDVQSLAKRLGGFLSTVHRDQNLFPRPLFAMEGAEELSVTDDFYALTGRQAVSATVDAGSHRQKMDPNELILQAEFRAAQATWPDKMSAIDIIKQLDSDKWTPKLKEFLMEVARSAPDSNHRLTAAERLPYKFLFEDPKFDISELLAKESDDRVLSVYLNLLGEAPDKESRRRATAAILNLLERDVAGVRRLTESSAISALTVLPTVADDDVTAKLLNWLTVAAGTDLVQRTALDALTKLAQQAGVDLVDKIIADEKVLIAFITGPITPWGRLLISSSQKESELKRYFRELLRAQPLNYASKLLETNLSFEHTRELLGYLYTVALDSRDENLAAHIFKEMLKKRSEDSTAILKLDDALRNMPDFRLRLLPYLHQQLEKPAQKVTFTEDDYKALKIHLESLAEEPKPSPLKVALPGPLADFSSWFPTSRQSKVKNPFFKFVPDSTTPPATLPAAATPVEYKTSSDHAILKALAQTVGSLILIIGPFILGFLFYRRDLPAAASFSTVLKSRLLLLLLDATIAFPVIHSYFQIDDVVRRGSWASAAGKVGYGEISPILDTGWKNVIKKNPGIIYGTLIPIAYALIQAHTKYVGPLSFRNQVIQFFINLPAIIFVAWDYRSRRGDSLYYY